MSEAQRAFKDAAGAIRRWRADPLAFAREALRVGSEPGEELEAWQGDMLRAYGEHNRTIAAACKGPGKTAVLSWCGWHFLLSYPNCKVPCTSITGPNLDDGLWTEFAKWQKRSPVLLRAFQWTKTRIFARGHSETWWASARKWSEDADPEQQANTLAGLHEDYLLFLLDEVSEYPDGVVSAAEAALTGGKVSKVVAAGNCTRNEGPLYRAVGADAHLWRVIRVSGDPDDPKRSRRIDKAEAQRQIDKYGRDSYIVRVNILGQFPERQADKLLDMRDCEQAMARALPEPAFENEPRIIGVDVARYGDDATVFFARQGRMGVELKEMRGKRTDEVGDHLIKSIKKWDADAAYVDMGGIGTGVVDHCLGRGWGHKVHGVYFGSNAMDSARFENKRTEMYWEGADWVKGGGCLPKDYLLAAELAAPVYWFDKKQRICLEQSADVKAKLGRSPDRASAFVLTFGGPVAPRPRFPDGTRATESRSVTEYDHLSRL
ncbi:MAG: hypothetical protein ACRD4T_00230 [Candidatus Acidiferrales bacterium]